ncbi:uncharacterized protein LOC142586960 [Dermacentor variabilis]|uniref:uncharacterized protein LOC142586960 n=1 Tax=Dermacentor variabilis TaxID=34621 RepID=UPI003F5BC6C6
MATLKLIAAVVFMASSAASYSSGGECDFSAVDVDAAVDQILAKFPANYTLTENKFVPVIAGLELGPLSVSGLNKITRYGAVQTYCVRGTRFLQVDFIHNSPVYFYAPWRMCSSQEGRVKIGAEFSRFTVLLRVEGGRFAENFVLHDEGPNVPVSTYNVLVIVEGAGEGVRTASAILSKLFPAYMTEFWNEQFFNHFTHFLHTALE